MMLMRLMMLVVLKAIQKVFPNYVHLFTFRWLTCLVQADFAAQILRCIGRRRIGGEWRIGDVVVPIGVGHCLH